MFGTEYPRLDTRQQPPHAGWAGTTAHGSRTGTSTCSSSCVRLVRCATFSIRMSVSSQSTSSGATWGRSALYSHGLDSHGLYNHGLYSYGLYSYGSQRASSGATWRRSTHPHSLPRWDLLWPLAPSLPPSCHECLHAPPHAWFNFANPRLANRLQISRGPRCNMATCAIWPPL